MTYLKEGQFPPDRDYMFIRHFGSTYSKDSLPPLITDVMEISSEEYHQRVQNIKDNHYIYINLLEISKLMEREREREREEKEKDKSSKIEETNNNKESSSKESKSKSKSKSKEVEKVLLVRAKGESTIFQIQHGVRRKLLNQALEFHGWSLENVKEISEAELHSYVIGAPVTDDLRF